METMSPISYVGRVRYCQGFLRYGVGLVKLTSADIPWTIKYDEFILVLHGSFTVTTETEELTASAMQSIWLPAGTKLTYKSDQAFLLYAIHPTDWASKT